MKSLDLREVIPLPGAADKGEGAFKYDLVANIVHEGKAEASEGSYRLHVHRKVEETWYEVSDLRVTDVLSPQVALSESYFQVYEIK